MDKLIITKQFRFEMAHMLEGHPGMCKNLHGHSYILEVSVSSNDDNDMIIDFSELKHIVNKCIVYKLDHAFAYDSLSTDPCQTSIVDTLNKFSLKTFAFSGRPTAENMSKQIYHIIDNEIKLSSCNISLVKVRLYETVTGWCDYQER